jgi:hypothetical protein
MGRHEQLGVTVSCLAIPSQLLVFALVVARLFTFSLQATYEARLVRLLACEADRRRFWLDTFVYIYLCDSPDNITAVLH